MSSIFEAGMTGIHVSLFELQAGVFYAFWFENARGEPGDEAQSRTRNP